MEDNKIFCVYVHTNKLNNKKYVGQSMNLKERWRCNGKNYFDSIKFFRAIKKYGWENFTHEIIKDNLNQEEADKLEDELIIQYDSIKNGYNLKKGGARGKLSEESLRKMSESLKLGYINHPERRIKISQNRKLPVYNEELRRRMSLNNPKSILITVNGMTNSFRGWAKFFGTSHQPYRLRYKIGGIEEVEKYIKEQLEKRETLVFR